MMIRGIYVFRTGGICIFNKGFDGFSEDPQSICAFLSAISLFSESTFGECLETVTTSRHKMLLHREEKEGEELSFVYLLDSNDELHNFVQKKDQVRKEFFHHFSSELPICLENNTPLPELPQFERNLTNLLIKSYS